MGLYLSLQGGYAFGCVCMFVITRKVMNLSTILMMTLAF